MPLSHVCPDFKATAHGTGSIGCGISRSLRLLSIVYPLPFLHLSSGLHPTTISRLTASSNCCNLRNMVTVKISEDARMLLRIIAANKGKTMYDVAEDLFWAEAKRLKLSIKGATKNGSRVKERK